MGTRCTNHIFIVDDSPAIRARLIELLAGLDGVAVVGEASNARDAIAAILKLRPHTVLLDLNLLGRTGLDVLREVRGEAPEIVFVVLTNHSELQYRRACSNAGASYFLDKTREFDRVPAVLAEIAAVRH